MDPIDTNARAARRSTAIAIIAVALTLATIATVGTQGGTSSSEAFARISDYLAQASEALTSQ